MGSLRNPIGPLPSSIYWRRRAVALAIVVLLALVVAWALSLGGDSEQTGGGGNEGKGHGSGPATSITPGPSGTGPAISQKPGGRDGSGGGESGGDGSGGASGADDGGNGTDSGGGSGGGPIGQGSGVSLVPTDSPLLNCTTGGATLTLRSVKDSYKPGEKPKFELKVKNSAGSACKVDLGRKAAVLTIKDTAGDDRVWASNDCPAGTGPALLKVPAKGSVERTVLWDRRASAPQCATPSAAAVPSGTYVIEAKVPGLDPAKAKFTLAKD
ncbi:hypothetical protein [Streptomyces natalensis]|uniref:Uncharacterized protein n=1 Tax=Streptomyces natalensis ATCC 27448 TaxID=1240678 RepID=A0A0D7CU54_9ACTN|nr:hypothetical protein [Streptomyces natalensis]KIZ19779.1 hypothetical protein SNA_00920 [Streptomyces natalensis ATCC 27448]